MLNSPRRCMAAPAHQRGASLLEVLVTILILAFGLLGIAGMTTSSLQTAKLSQFQSTALQLANEYAERMRGNIEGVKAGDYDLADGYDGDSSIEAVPTCSVADSCTPAELASIDQTEWLNHLRNHLPAGGAYVQRDGLAADIWVMWQDLDLSIDGSSTLSATDTGGRGCPADAVDGAYSGPQPTCVYYRVSL